MSDEQLKPLNRRLRYLTAGAIVLAVAVLVAITTTSGSNNTKRDLLSGGTSSPSKDGSAGDAPLAATDQGVTATSIKLGTFRADPALLARFGLADSKIEQVAQAYADEINAHGGVHGRKLIMDVTTIANPLDNNLIQQGCRRAFGDNHDFMIVNDQAFPGLAQCAADFGRGLTDSGYGGLSAATAKQLNDLGGRYWTVGASSNRFVRQWADFLAREYGTDTKIGIVNHYDESLVEVGRQLTAALEQRGFAKPSYFQHTSDPSTAAIQLANGVAQFRRDGVQLIVPVTNPIVVGQSQRGMVANGFTPAKGWSFSSIALLDSPDLTGLYVPAQMNGARGISFVRMPAEKEQAKCRGIVAERAPDAPWTSASAQLCHVMFQNLEALRNAGPVLTIKSWARGYSQLATYDGNDTGEQTFSRTKRDGANEYRVWEFKAGKFSVVSNWRK